MSVINASEYLISDLKRWCDDLGLPNHGSAADLAMRIGELAVDVRRECPKGGKEEAIPDVKGSVEPEKLSSIELLKLKAELMAKERELVKKELLLARQEIEVLRNNTANKADKSSVEYVKEFLPEYSGKTNVYIWLHHVEQIKNKFNLSDDDICRLMLLKIVGEAREALDKVPGFSCMKYDHMCYELKTLFECNLPEFFARTSVDMWLYEVEQMRNKFGLREDDIRKLMLLKIVGEAREKVNKVPGFSSMKYDQMRYELEKLFESLSQYSGTTNIYTWMEQVEQIRKKFNMKDDDICRLMVMKIVGEAREKFDKVPDFPSMNYKEMREILGRVYLTDCNIL